MGQMFLYDLYQARHSIEDFDKYTLDEVDRTFEMMTQLKYNQTVNGKLGQKCYLSNDTP